MREKYSLMQIIAFSLFFAMLMLFAGCAENSDITNDSTKVSDEVSVDETSILNTEIVVEQSSFYKTTQCDFLYSYTIYNKDNNVVKIENDLPKQPHIIMVEDNLVRVTIQSGTGIGTQFGYYYDVENDQFSTIYQCIFDQCNGLVAHTSDGKVIIQDIFSNDGYYLEISEFQNKFSKVAYPFVDVKFSDDGKSVSVTYFSGEDYKKVYETFNL